MTSVKKDDILILLSITKAKEMCKGISEQLEPVMARIFPDVPENVWKKIKSSWDFNVLIDLLVPVYDKVFTHGEIVEIIKMYRTSIGKKLIESGQEIISSAMKAGEKWGQITAQKAQKDLEELGYKSRDIEL